MYSVEKSFLSDAISEDVIYIYTYESGFPVIITFSMGDDGVCNC